MTRGSLDDLEFFIPINRTPSKKVTRHGNLKQAFDILTV